VKNLIRRVGQRFMVGFEGLAASADVKALIRDFGVAHVILFARNVDGPEQVADLVRELQSAAREAGHERPLLVGVDQEGGRVSRMKEPWTVWPPPRALGRMGSEETARRVGAALAEELRACGIAMNVAPVVDVDTNPMNPVIGDRSFGDNPDLVGRLGAAMIRGLQDGGVAACAKHFPGHGDTAVDSHLDLPVVEHSRPRLDDVELPPFRACIEAGVATVLPGHVLVRELDEEFPATLSPRVVRELLHDMEMKAVAKRWKPAELSVMAVKAGCDILEFCHTHDAQVEAMEGLIRAAEAEEIPFSDMEAAEGRVKQLQERFLLDYQDPDPGVAREAAGRGEHRALAEEIVQASGLPA
jgi:beta-N-acetylhexosaminidase